jgi:hypothetical protein
VESKHYYVEVTLDSGSVLVFEDLMVATNTDLVSVVNRLVGGECVTKLYYKEL